MRVTAEQYAGLEAAITRLDTNERRARYLAGDFSAQWRGQGSLDRRYRWDLFWAAPHVVSYGDLNDSHIDTALRRIVPPLGGKS